MSKKQPIKSVETSVRSKNIRFISTEIQKISVQLSFHLVKPGEYINSIIPLYLSLPGELARACLLNRGCTSG